MKTELFSVYDRAASAYMEPFHAPTIESAIRSFRHTVNHGKNNLSQFPEDYTLFHIGTFFMEDGTVVPLATPHSLGVAVTFLEKKEPQRDRYRELMNAAGPINPETSDNGS